MQVKTLTPEQIEWINTTFKETVDIQKQYKKNVKFKFSLETYYKDGSLELANETEDGLYLDKFIKEKSFVLTILNAIKYNIKHPDKHIDLATLTSAFSYTPIFKIRNSHVNDFIIQLAKRGYLTELPSSLYPEVTLVTPKTLLNEPLLLLGSSIKVKSIDKVNSKTREQNILCDSVLVKHKCTNDNIKRLELNIMNEVKNYKTLKNYGIHIPIIYKSWNIMKMLDFNKVYVYKSYYSARSVGKAVVTPSDLIAMLHWASANKDLDDNAIKCFEDTFSHIFKFGKGLFRNNEERNKVCISLCNGKYFLQEEVKIEKEYRIICFYKSNETLVQLREGYGYCEKEMNETTVHESEIDSNLLKQLKSFITDKQYITLSFDVYKDIDGNWGVLEFSNNYAIDYPTELLNKGRECITEAFYKMKEDNLLTTLTSSKVIDVNISEVKESSK